ncbi:carbohydrate-responsive element-binding protein isoform X2 [Parasteatoda tepidariorum]|uniref:carbohydrate-responsive element-binding protein isoform X2 n=1 Tax=Parasteatoda tepidariorum TaxID=114398 RepID=UPI0039BD681D
METIQRTQTSFKREDTTKQYDLESLAYAVCNEDKNRQIMSVCHTFRWRYSYEGRESKLYFKAVVIEGTYWKRRMASITAEYQKWRLFYREKCRLKSSYEAENMDFDFETRWPSWTKDPYSPLQSAMDEDFLMDFTDTLFTSFNPSQPFDFPNPREIAARASIADFIQPGLVQLQPPVDDIMDTLEPLSDLFTDFLNARLPPLPEENTFNGGSLQDIGSSTVEQQDYYGKSPFFQKGYNVFNSYSSQFSPNLSSKRSCTFKKPAVPSAIKQSPQSYIAPSSFSAKRLVENITPSNESNAILSNNVPLISSTQPPTQSDSMQNFLCNTVPNQPSQNSSMESLLQSGLGTDVTTLQSPQPPDSLQALQVPSSDHIVNKREQRMNQFFQQPSFISKSLDETDLSRQHLPQPSSTMQVPLETIPQGHVVNNLVSNSNSNGTNNGKAPFYYSVVNQMNQTPVANNFKNQNQVTIASNTYQTLQPVSVATIVKQTQADVTFTENSAYRRHSYSTVPQHAQSSGDYMGTRRSRPIAPAITNASFAVPEVPSNRRARSRSVSSPQSGSPKSFLQQPAQAVSLTDISSPLQTVITADSGKRPIIQSSLGQGVNISNSNVLQQNLLAHLLSSGCTQQDLGQTLLKVASAPTTNATSSVTIIRPILTTTAPQTLVFSPLPMSTISSSNVTDLQRNILVGGTNQILCKQDSPPTCVLSTPDSPGSSTCSSSPAISTMYDTNSSTKSVRVKSPEEKNQYKEHRRVCHINAEQKRRCNIKNGFESLHNLLPALGQTPNSKVSKAAMLQRGAEYIRTLKVERQQQIEEVEQLKKRIEELNQAINLYQSQLPASGAPVPCQRTNRMKEMFDEYVRQQTLQNPKFYIFSLIVGNLVDSFNSSVSTASVEEMCKSIGLWMDQHCSLVSLRPKVLNALRLLSTTTSILSDPSRVPEEAIQAVTKKESRQ